MSCPFVVEGRYCTITKANSPAHRINGSQTFKALENLPNKITMNCTWGKKNETIIKFQNSKKYDVQGWSDEATHNCNRAPCFCHMLTIIHT
jgi:hypothetical protein